MYPELWITLNQQVDVLRHDFHTQDFCLMLFTNLTDDLFQPCSHLPYQDLAPILRAPDDMILARVVHSMIGLVCYLCSHAKIIQPIAI
jgi:hypothetical protein